MSVSPDRREQIVCTLESTMIITLNLAPALVALII
jgi:hypothetical protein